MAPAAPRRLAAVEELVPWGSRVADVGADHGSLACDLLVSGRATYCIATERDDRFLDGLRRLASRAGCGKLETRVGDGLKALRPEDRIGTVVMAGLGARTIVRLLDGEQAARLGLERVILQPQTEAGRVRRWLGRHGFTIVAERLALERGRYYEVIAAEPADGGRLPTHPGLSTDDLYEAGPCLLRSGDPLFRRLWHTRYRRLERIVERMAPGADRLRAAQRRDQALRILAAV